MPFTLSHVIAIVPVAVVTERKLPFSALVIGSMIPDFPMFVPLSPAYDTTHSISGLLTADLPLGLACFFCFQWIMKRPLFFILPQYIQRRTVRYSSSCVQASWKFLLCTCVAILLGSWTHVGWDSFTHVDRWGSEVFPSLSEQAVSVLGHPVSGASVLQYVSSFGGLFALAVVLVIWLRRQQPSPMEDNQQVFSTSQKRLISLIGLSIMIAVAATAIVTLHLPTSQRIGKSIRASGFALLAELLAYCVCVRFMKTGRETNPKADA